MATPPRCPRPMRVLHLTSTSAAGGVSRYIHDLSRRMHERGHQVAVAGRRGDWHELFDRAPWPWVDAPLNGGPTDLLRSYRTLRRYLRDHPVDIVHSHYRKAMLVGRALTLGHPRRHCLATLHSIDAPMTGLYRWLTDFGEHVHAPSDLARRRLLEAARVPPEKITVIPHGIDPAQYPIATADDQAAARHALGLPTDATVAAYAGRFGPQKNPHWLLDLAAGTRQMLPDLHIVMAGSGSMKNELHQRIQRDHLTGRVTLLGYRDPLPLYQAADAALLPSDAEGFALMVVEAMSVGRPVLRTDTGGAAEQIRPGETGQLTPVDHDRFLDAAAAFLSDRDRLHQMGAAAADYTRQHLTLDLQVQRTEAMYRGVMGATADD